MTLAFSLDGRMLASTSGGYTIQLWDSITGTCAQTLDCCSQIPNVLSSPLNDVPLEIDHAGAFFDFPAAGTDKLNGDHGDYINAIGFTLEGKLLASRSMDCTIWTWDIEIETENEETKTHLQQNDPLNIPTWSLSRNWID